MSDKLTGIKSQFVRNASDRQVGAIFVNLAKYQQVIRCLKLKNILKIWGFGSNFKNWHGICPFSKWWTRSWAPEPPTRVKLCCTVQTTASKTIPALWHTSKTQVVLPDGQSPLQVSHLGWSIGRRKRVKRLPVVALPIAIPQAPLLALTFRRCLEATSSISHLFAPDAISEATTSGLTPNWSEYPVDSNQRTVCNA